ncbi:hypothetical protein ACVWY0_004505 [Arthrobacter sp. UYNi723]
MFSLGIEIEPELVARQADWFAPTRQPFLVPKDSADSIGRAPLSGGLPAELRDTFEIYNVPDELVCVLVGEEEFNDLGRTARSDLVRSQIRLGREVIPSVRSAPADVRALAGTFPHASGPNCFGTVMAAAGGSEAADVWMLQEPFEEWLSAVAVPGGNDNDPGTVFVWRSTSGLAQHAAVTIGGGYALHKPSQGWMSPRKVLTVQEVIASARQPGRRLTRYALTVSRDRLVRVAA